MLAWMGQSPSARVVGTWMAIWYKPAEPGASAAPYTVADVLFTVTAGADAVEKPPLAGTETPDGEAGIVGPNPVAHRMSTPPGLAGTVVEPAKVPAFAA